MNNFSFNATGTSPHVIELGTVSDGQGDSYSIEFEVGANSSITFNETMMTLSIAPETEPGTYVCKIFLTDDNLKDPQTSKYEFVITINEAVEEMVLLIEYKVAIEADEDAPYIMVDPMNLLGMVLIKFSQEMNIPNDLTIIDDTVLHV